MRNIIILAVGPSWSECKFDREVWGVNSVARWPWRLDKLFFVDPLETFNPSVMTVEDAAAAHTRGVQLITTQKNAAYAAKFGIPTTIFPLHEIVAKFKTTYFANTICYMVAYAMHQNVDNIAVYGADHLTNQTYILERPGLEYWLGRAEQAGIGVEIAEGSALLKTMNGKMYGYDDFYQNPHSEVDKVLVA